MKTAVVIFSGGQDSTTCLYWALKQFDKVHTITFDYGQKHNIELECARSICDKETVSMNIVDISFLRQVCDSAMLSKGNISLLNKKLLPSSFVPNRNQLFITLAHMYAQKIEAQHLVTGVCQTDYSGYPDCREKFIEMIQVVTNMGSQSEIQIHTPLMHLTKAETFLMAEKLGVLQEVIELTHTCYEGNREKYNTWGYGCGVCPACLLREKGWKEYKES